MPAASAINPHTTAYLRIAYIYCAEIKRQNIKSGFGRALHYTGHTASKRIGAVIFHGFHHHCPGAAACQGASSGQWAWHQ